jgi:hypothetical protein
MAGPHRRRHAWLAAVHIRASVVLARDIVVTVQGRIEAVHHPALDSTIRVHNLQCSACSVRKNDRAAPLAGAQARRTEHYTQGMGTTLTSHVPPDKERWQHMDQLINLVVQRTGIPPNQAQQAVQVVVGFLKDRLPGPIASQVDSVLSGASTGGSVTGQAQQDLGGMLGQKPQPPQQP